MNENQRVAAVAIAAIAVAGVYVGIQQYRVKYMRMHVRAVEAQNRSLRERLGRERYCVYMLTDNGDLYPAYITDGEIAAREVVRKARQEWDSMDPDQREVIVRQQEHRTTEML